jgi:hypothetical protein
LQIHHRHDRSQGVFVWVRPVEKCHGHASSSAKVRATRCSHHRRPILLLLCVSYKNSII